MNFRYILLRLIRHFLPDSWVVFLKNRNLFFQPGMETHSPLKAVEHYRQVLTQHGLDLVDKKVMVFGYGGNLSIGCELINAGAGMVCLVEQKGFSADFDINKISQNFPECFINQSGEIIPDPRKLQLFHEDLEAILQRSDFEKVDLVLSNSVFEHVREPQPIATLLANLTKAQGSQLHFIDLRDHYFKYPFEMLSYPENVWNHWLNPTSHLNRLRAYNYREIFQQAFKHTEVVIDASDTINFLPSLKRIRPEFLSGNQEEDSATLIHVVCQNPIS
jgi:hypothetical protein